MPARSRRRSPRKPLTRMPDPAACPTLTIPQAARLVGISPSCAYKAADQGHLPVIPMGGQRLVPTAKLVRILGLDRHLAREAGERAAGLPDPAVHPTLTLEQAADILNISRSQAYVVADRGHLPVVQMAGRRVVPTAELLRMLGFTTGSGERTAA